MSLASALLKRGFIVKTLGVPWHSIRFGRKGHPVHGKPCYLLPNGTPAPVEFNVSHQAGLVALLGSQIPGFELGVDIVCVNERDDYRTIDKEGFAQWVDIHEEFFSEDELFDMKYKVDDVQLLDGTLVGADELGRHDRCCSRDRQLSIMLKNGQQRTLDSGLIVDAKLRRFYTFWCYKEAFIKLTGEAMMASWLRQVEFRNVRAPKPGTVARCSTYRTWGERVNDLEIWLHGRKLGDVNMEIQAFDENYMIATAVRSSRKLGNEVASKFKALNLERDLFPLASEQ